MRNTAAVAVAFAVAVTGCAEGPGSQQCGVVLSDAECQIVRGQLGTLAPAPPPDPTNQYGQGTQTPSDPGSMAELSAFELGRHIFYDRCLSSGRDTACVTCHDPGAGLIDSRPREVLRSVMVMGLPKSLPLIHPAGQPQQPTTPDLVGMAPPAVEPELDLAGNPLATFDAATMQWHGVVRRPQTSISSEGKAFTGRNSPSLYNVAYGAGIAPMDGARTAGVTWVPWEGRYDSVWSLVADVFEFGGTMRTNRAHVALRIFREFRMQYEQTFSLTMPNFDAVDMNSLRIYPANASPNAAAQAQKDCWNSTPDMNKCPLGTLAPSAQVKSDINQVFVNAGKALSAYIRHLRSGSSAYDKWLANPADPGAMPEAAQRGLQLFIGKANCVLCHNGPNFSDWRFHNLGVPADDPEHHANGGAVPVPSATSTPPDCTPGSPPKPTCPDEGRFAWQDRLSGRCQEPTLCQKTVTTSCLGSMGAYNDSHDPKQCLPPLLFDPCGYGTADACRQDPACAWSDMAQGCVPVPREGDLGAFKTPSLRNIARTWPYMHNGSLSDFGPAEAKHVSPADANADPTPHLLKVLAFYNQGGGTPVVGTRDPMLKPLRLDGGEMADLAEFLKALTDESAVQGEAGMDPMDDPMGMNCPM